MCGTPDYSNFARTRTRKETERRLRLYAIRRLGRRRIASITHDDVADLIGQMQAAGKAA